jgi:tetratricopeptide (TPR) repeat protein
LLAACLPAAEGGAASQTPAKGEGVGQDTSFYQFYLDRYRQARERAAKETNNFTATWEFSRACFDLGEFATNDTQRAAVAEEGIAASRRAIALKENHPAGHYYLGMNLGQLARTKQLGALRLVKEMQDAFYRARELEAKFDYAGADRCLGLLYRDAPGWPLSVGNRALARQHLLQALQLAPLYPENPLNWAETLWQWRQWEEARKQLPAVQRAFAAARTNLTGMEWAASWRDWTNRWQVLTNRLPTVEK